MSENSFDSNDSQVNMALKLREIDINMDKQLAQEDERMGRKFANLTEQLYQFEEQYKSSRKGGSSVAGSRYGGSTNTDDRIIRSIYSNSDDEEEMSEASIKSARSNRKRKAAIRQETYERLA